VEPRYFWRRVIAMLIDFILLSQLALYLMVPFADGDTVRLSGGIYPSITCRTVPLEPESQAYFAERGVVAENGSLCTSYQNGYYAGSNLLVSSDTNSEGNIAENATTLSVALDRQGQEVTPVFPVSYAAPIMVLLGIILMTWLWNGQTFGKKVTRVQVLTVEDHIPGPIQIVRREVLKFAPSILVFLLGIFLPEYALEQVVPNLRNGEDIALVLGFLGVSTFVYILWWVAPLIWWNGSMPYDRINKTIVTRY